MTNGSALAGDLDGEAEANGFVKLVARRSTGRLVGAHLIGPGDLAHLTGDNCSVIGIVHDHLDNRTRTSLLRRLNIDDTVSVRATGAQLVEKVLNAAAGGTAQLRATRGDPEPELGAGAGAALVDDVAAASWSEYGLGRREIQVLSGIASGLSNYEIAENLYLSINSVKTYIRGL